MCLACDFGVCIMRRETGGIKGVGLVLAICFEVCVIVFGIGSQLLMTQCDNIDEVYETIEHTIVIGGS
jgi:hypothetical protein